MLEVNKPTKLQKDTKRIKYFSINNNPANNQEVKTDIDTSFCLCPVRNFNIEKHHYKNVSNIAHIVQIRDPRDILVSGYFSFGWIHSDAKWSEETKQKREAIKLMSIDEYVLKTAETDFWGKPLKERYQPILNISTTIDSQITIVKYEEMVMDFKSWLLKVIKPFQFNPVLETIFLERCYQKYRKEFEKNNESLTHKRKITPGDHREKLRPETIKKLNHIFQDVLLKFNYN